VSGVLGILLQLRAMRFRFDRHFEALGAEARKIRASLERGNGPTKP
jgi:hypothetical protein